MQSVIVLGPSGVGKSVLEAVFQVETRIEPHRVRKCPRNSEDVYYLSRMAHEGIRSILVGQASTGPFGGAHAIVMYEKVVLFNVRKTPQVLFLPNAHVSSGRKKIEIYGPVLEEMRKRQDNPALQPIFEGEAFVVLLNPWDRSISSINPETASDPTSVPGRVLVDLLVGRREQSNEIADRLSNIPEELEAWKSMASTPSDRFHVLECVNWAYAEHTFLNLNPADKSARLVQAKQEVQRVAKATLSDDLTDQFERLLKPDAEIF